MSANSWIPIGVNSGAASDYTFSAIPAGYKELILRGHMQSSTSAFTTRADMRCNGDDASNYNYYSYGYVANYTLKKDASSSTGEGYLTFLAGSYLGDWGGFFETHIFGVDDTSRWTQWVTATGNGGGTNGYNISHFAGGLWRNTAAVTSLTTVSANWDAGSYVSLYGRK